MWGTQYLIGWQAKVNVDVSQDRKYADSPATVNVPIGPGGWHGRRLLAAVWGGMRYADSSLNEAGEMQNQYT